VALGATMSGEKWGNGGGRPLLGFDGCGGVADRSCDGGLLLHFKAVDIGLLRWDSFQCEGRGGTMGPPRCFLA
jgi:hypothetical protein